MFRYYIRCYYSFFKLLFALLLVTPVLTQATTLDEIFVSTNLKNPDLLSSRLELFSQAEIIEQAYGLLYPQINLALRGAYNEVKDRFKTTPTESEYYTDGRASISLRQEIFRGGSLWYGIAASRALLGAALEDLRVSEQNIFQSALQAYMNYGRFEAIANLRIGNVERLTQHLLATEQAFVLGEVNRTDVALAESRLAIAVAEHQEALGNSAEALAEYIRIIGIEPDTYEIPKFIAKPTISDKNLVQDVEVLLQYAYLHNPLMKAAVMRLEEAKYQVDLERSRHFPQISATATWAQDDFGARDNNNNFRTDKQNSLTVIGEVSVPIYHGGQISSAVRQAKFRHRQAQQQLIAARLQVKKDVVSALAQYSTALAQQESRQKAIDSAKLALQGSETEYRLGSRNILDLLDSEQILVEAEIGSITSEAALQISYYRLLAAIGELTTQSLKLQDPLSEVAIAITDNKNVRRAIRRVKNLGDE